MLANTPYLEFKWKAEFLNFEIPTQSRYTRNQRES